MEQTPMTARGEQKLREELERLKTQERPRITAAIAEARSHGDLSENAEYDAAKEEQGLCEARIKDIEAKLASANIIDVTKLKTAGPLKVVFGSTVTLVDVDTDKEITYKIVGEDEADIEHNLRAYWARLRVTRSPSRSLRAPLPMRSLRSSTCSSVKLHKYVTKSIGL